MSKKARVTMLAIGTSLLAGTSSQIQEGGTSSGGLTH
jgi:hypothetical protein